MPEGGWGRAGAKEGRGEVGEEGRGGKGRGGGGGGGRWGGGGGVCSGV